MGEVGEKKELETTKVIPVGHVKLLNCCKQFCQPKSVGHFVKYSRRHVYFKRDSWEVPFDVYEKALVLYQEKITRSNQKNKQKPKIIQLIPILRRLFTANQSAKSCIKRSTRSNAYSRKNDNLSKAVELAFNIQLPFFDWGIQLDDNTPGYEIVVFFQIGDDPAYQISFHTSSIGPCPAFSGEWNGINQEKFPLSVPLVRKFMKQYQISNAKLLAMEKEGMHDDREIVDYDIVVSDMRESRYEERERERMQEWDDDFQTSYRHRREQWEYY